MHSTPNIKIKINPAAKRFIRYRPQQWQQVEQRIEIAETVNLYEYLNFPKLYDGNAIASKNKENLAILKYRLKKSKVLINQKFHYRDECYFQILSEVINDIPVKKIQSISFIQEIDFELYLNSNINQLFNFIENFSKTLFEAPWRSLYPYLSELLKINNTFNSLQLWENLEADFKFKLGNVILKDFRISIRHFNGEMAILGIDYRIKLNSKSTPKTVRLNILTNYLLGVWQISEMNCDEFFNTQ